MCHTAADSARPQSSEFYVPTPLRGRVRLLWAKGILESHGKYLPFASRTKPLLQLHPLRGASRIPVTDSGR